MRRWWMPLVAAACAVAIADPVAAGSRPRTTETVHEMRHEAGHGSRLRAADAGQAIGMRQASSWRFDRESLTP